ncbi:MAG: leucine-rich repeat protein [Clostridia bacterium]|nr:leucine-rich repeat protein [Clostridia bacterium]
MFHSFSVSKDAIATIPDYIKQIGANAFCGCGALTDITIRDGVTKIGDCAFTECTALQSVTIPGSVSGVNALGKRVFLYCTALKTATLQSGVSRVADGMFGDCQALETVTLPESVTVIGEDAFCGCGALKYVYYTGTAGDWDELRDGVQIGDGNDDLTDARLFSYNIGKNLTCSLSEDGTLTICGTGPMKDFDSLEEYPYSTSPFAGNDRIKKLVIEDGMTNVGNRAFRACGALADTYYEGTAQKWGAIPVGSDNEALTGAVMHYGKVPFTVTYDANGGKKAPAAQTAAGSLTLTAAKPKKTLKLTLDANGGEVSETTKKYSVTFTGWNTAADGSGTAYAPGEVYIGTADVTLYAQWTNPTFGALPTPTRSGYLFLGWYTKAKGGVKITANTELTADRTIWAHYRKDHIHEYTQRSDEDNHWQECVCGDIIDMEAHTFGGWIIDREPTAAENGEKHRSCTVCGYADTEPIPATGETETTAPAPTEPTQPSEPGTTEPPRPSEPAGLASSDESKVRVDNEQKQIFALPGSAQDVLGDLLGNGGENRIVGKDGGEIPDGKPVGTGTRLITADGTEYAVIVPMDVNGDGKVNSQDARIILRAAARLETLDGIVFLAADSDGNGKIASADARRALRVAAKLDIIALR